MNKPIGWVIVLGLMGCGGGTEVTLPSPIAVPPADELDLNVSEVIFNGSSDSELGSVQVRGQDGRPLINAPVEWSLLLASEGMPAGTILFPSAVTDDQGIAVTKVSNSVEFSEPLTADPVETGTRLLAMTGGTTGGAAILSSATAGDGADYADAQASCSVGEQVILTTPLIAVNGALLSANPPTTAPAIDPRVALAVDLRVISEFPGAQLQVTLACLSPGITTILLPGTNAVGELRVEVGSSEL